MTQVTDQTDGDFRICGYASSSGRHGNQRDFIYGDVCARIWTAFAAIYAAQPWDFLLRTDADQCTYDLCGTSYHWKKKRRDTKDVINCNEGRTFEKGETGYAWIL